jgi:predicted ABC-type transport system involved in lysophospholipase L1 biosynthesis ATPase subunit
VTTQPLLREAVVGCRDVVVTFGNGETTIRALEGVSLEVHEGQRIALFGRSGSGKTSLLHVLGGLIEPTSGSVVWHGRPLSSIDHAARGAARARGIAFVFQGANLLPYFTAFENVAFAAQLDRRSSRLNLGADALLELVGLGAKLDHLPAELSGGEAERVAIARALAQEPELLLCDEPTGHLDRDTGTRVLDLVDALQSEFGFAIVVATHDPHVAARYDRQIELEDGIVVGEASAR